MPKSNEVEGKKNWSIIKYSKQWINEISKKKLFLAIIKDKVSLKLIRMFEKNE